MAIRIPQPCLRLMASHAQSVCPMECCGALIGHDLNQGDREVTQVVPIPNCRRDDPRHGFDMAPEALLQAERAARASGCAVVGIYHSHPDGGSCPSARDRAGAQSFWSYVIISCACGRAERMQSWRLRHDRCEFVEEEIL